MPSDAMRAARTVPVETRTPSMLDLIRLSPRRLFPPGGIELYRQIALLTALDKGREVLDVACGKGVALEYFVREFGATGSGVDVDPALIEAAEARTRAVDLDDRLHFQTGRSDALPYRDEIFDVAIGEVGLASHCEPADAVRELVRVTKPGGFIVLVQLVWKAPVDDQRRDMLAGHLGAQPRMVVEWKRLLREAGVHDLHTEDWSDDRTAFRPSRTKPFPDFAEIFSTVEKAGILRRAWGQWGWRGVRAALGRERAVHRLLTRERILGLDLLKGRKAVPTLVGVDAGTGSPGDRAVQARPGAQAVQTRPADQEALGRVTGGGGPETDGLPLFGGGAGPDDGGDRSADRRASPDDRTDTDPGTPPGDRANPGRP